MRSSYIEHDYGEVLQLYVRLLKPLKLVELGVLDGYSTKHIAEGLRCNWDEGEIKANFTAYDLFEGYPFKHGDKLEVEKMLADRALSNFVRVRKGDAFEVYQNYENSSIDLMHVDISNAGDLLRDIIKLWTPKLKVCGVILFEGGSEERDKVDWMVKYNRPPIKTELETNDTIRQEYVYSIYQKFPSLTVLIKKR